jgi:hypothetical protein
MFLQGAKRLRSSKEGQKGLECEVKREERSHQSSRGFAGDELPLPIIPVLVMGHEKQRAGSSPLWALVMWKRTNRTLNGPPHSSLLLLVVKVETAKPNMQVTDGNRFLIHGWMLLKHFKNTSEHGARLSYLVSKGRN